MISPLQPSLPTPSAAKRSQAPPPEGSPASQDSVAPGRPALGPTPGSTPGVTALKAELDCAPFAKFMKYRKFNLQVQRPQGVETVSVGILNGPGHDVAAMASLVLDPTGRPRMLLKTGDTRIARVLRGDDYVKLGSVAGRLDKVGADFAKIGLAELSEEVGGVVVGDSLRQLGQYLSPTMPHESTECDACFLALVQLQGAPSGDGGGMEVVDLIGPAFLTPEQGWQALQQGQVSDAARCQMLYGRAYDSMGFVRELGVYVQDYPALQARFDSLGLGQPVDPRGLAQNSEIPPPRPPGTSLESQINNGFFSECQQVPLGAGAKMLDGKTCHAVAATPVGAPIPNQILSLDYDRGKVIHFAQDAERGPLVRMTAQERPLFAVRQLLLAGECPAVSEQPAWQRQDVDEVVLQRDRPGQEQVGPDCMSLGLPSTASSGQCDLKMHYFAVPDQANSDYIPLAQALRQCRQGQGDSHTEAALLRLADQLHWIPSLGMSLEQARQYI